MLIRMSTLAPLKTLLFDFANSSDPRVRERLESESWAKYGKTGAVFVLDMARFSQTSLERGIVYYLALVRRMQVIVGPIIDRYEGEIVKFEADNCFAHFATVEQALDVAVGIHIAIGAANRTTPDDLDIEVSIGIDHGDFLRLEGDYFGNAVNLASKLGEDIGGAGDVILTQTAIEFLGNQSRFSFEPAQYSISGMVLDAFHLVR
jgi:adenylate cyclase